MTHSVDATELQRRVSDKDSQELPAHTPVLNQLQHRVVADALLGGFLLQHLLHLCAVVLVAPQLPQSCGGESDEESDQCDDSAGLRPESACAPTSLAGLLVSSVQQQESGGFRQEWKCGELEQRRETVESEQPGPPLLSTEELAASATFSSPSRTQPV